MKSIDVNSVQRLQTINLALRFLHILGLIGFLGGLAALSALWAFGPVPQTIDQWNMLITQVKAIFFACSFSGIVILIVAGLISWLRRWRELNAARWFRVMMAMLLVAVPASHLWARSTAEELYVAVDAGRFDEAAERWDQLGISYIVSLTAMVLIAAIGLLKPRLGQRIDQDTGLTKTKNSMLP